MASMDKDLKLQAAELAGGYFAAGLNCCESVIRTMLELSDTDLPDRLVDLGKYFRRGMGAGCTCGALVGGVMMLGLLKPYDDANLGRELNHKFAQEFGSTCCREIRKKQGLLCRLSNDKCREITARTAGLVTEIWQKH